MLFLKTSNQELAPETYLIVRFSKKGARKNKVLPEHLDSTAKSKFLKWKKIGRLYVIDTKNLDCIYKREGRAQI